jgi:hypothetical protein
MSTSVRNQPQPHLTAWGDNNVIRQQPRKGQHGKTVSAASGGSLSSGGDDAFRHHCLMDDDSTGSSMVFVSSQPYAASVASLPLTATKSSQFGGSGSALSPVTLAPAPAGGPPSASQRAAFKQALGFEWSPLMASDVRDVAALSQRRRSLLDKMKGQSTIAGPAAPSSKKATGGGSISSCGGAKQPMPTTATMTLEQQPVRGMNVYTRETAPVLATNLVQRVELALRKKGVVDPLKPVALASPAGTDISLARKTRNYAAVDVAPPSLTRRRSINPIVRLHEMIRVELCTQELERWECLLYLSAVLVVLGIVLRYGLYFLF